MSRQKESGEQLKPTSARKRGTKAEKPSSNQSQNVALPNHTTSSTPVLDQVMSNARTRTQPVGITGQTEPDTFVCDFLPNFTSDHRQDLNATRIPCGEVTGVDGIREEIQLRFVPKVGPGYFRITARMKGKSTGLRWVEYVDALTAEDPQSETNDDELNEDAFDESYIEERPMMPREFKRESELIRVKAELEAMKRYSNPISTQAKTKSVIDEALEAVAAQRIKELLAPPPVQAASNPVQPAMTLEAVVAKLLLENPETNSNVVERIATRLLGDEEKEDGGIMKEVIRAAPAIVTAIFQGMQSIQPLTMPDGAQVPMQPTATPASAITQHAPVDTFAAAYPRTMSLLIAAIHDNKPHRPVIAAADYLVQNFEEGASVEQVLNQPAEVLAQILATYSPEGAEAASQPHAIAWIESFLEQFFGTDETADGETAKSGASASAVTPANSVRTA